MSPVLKYGHDPPTPNPGGWLQGRDSTSARHTVGAQEMVDSVILLSLAHDDPYPAGQRAGSGLPPECSGKGEASRHTAHF